MQTRNLSNHTMPPTPRVKRGLIFSGVLALSLLATAFIPHLKQLPTIKREEVRPVQSPSTLQVVPRIVTGELSIVNYRHRAVSVHGVVADQTYRMFAAVVFLGFYVMRIFSSNRTVRAALAAFSLLGAAGCVSDVISFWVLGGVVDWIGVNGRSAFAPSDVCWALAPAGILLVFTFGLMTFNLSPAPESGKTGQRPR